MAAKAKAPEQLQGVVAFGQHFPDHKIAWKYVHCAGYDDYCGDCGYASRRLSGYKTLLPAICRKCNSSNVDRRFHHFANISCNCKPGPQAQALMLPAYEIAMGGGRGGLKTETGFTLCIRGNPKKVQQALRDGKQPDPVDVSYINSKNYRFLVLRKNAKDMKDCWSRAKRFFGLWTSNFNDSDMVVRFPSGAEGVFDHMAHEDAYEKYQGQEFQLVWAEELTQIPTETLYEKIAFGSCRSSDPQLQPLLFVTANPGGPGSSWFKRRFIECTTPGEVFVDSKTGLTRVFIQSTVFDNPYFLRDNALYVKQLESFSDEIQRRKWLYGDWNVLEGQFFTEFRSERRPGEPESALHVVADGSIELLPHWHRWISMDWGFGHSADVQWHCHASDQRIYTYREMCAANIGSREWGVRIAQASLADLEGLESHQMTIYLSPDAFGKRDEVKTPAEQIADGIDEVIGAGAAFVMDFDDRESRMPTEQAIESMMRRKHLRQKKTSIVIQRAQNARVAGWNFMRDLLRWSPLLPDSELRPDPKRAEQIQVAKGVLARLEYERQFEQARNEVLPKWRIFASCHNLIRGMEAAQFDEGTEDVLKQDGDDPIDCARYGMVAFQPQKNRIPKSSFVNEALQQYDSPGLSTMSRFQIAQHAEKQYEKQNAPFQPIVFQRRTGRRVSV